MADTQSNLQFFRQMFGGAWIAQGLSVAAALGIADLLADGPRSVRELAERTQSHGGSLFRLMRALAGVGVFARDADGRFKLTPLAELLRSDVAGSQRSFAIMMGTEFYQAWGKLLHSVRTGQPGFQHRYGASFFEYMTAHPDRHGIYDEAMNGIHDAETQPVLDAYDFSTFGTLVDIGGGNGLALAAILRRYPEMRGILFDLPAVVDRAWPLIADSDCAGRFQAVAGDFFASVPAKADAYIMRHVIHDWEDEPAITLLRRCREAMNPDGRVLVIETVIPTGDEPCFGKWLDLMMLLVGGRERTEEEYRRLFTAAGLKLSRIVPSTAEVSVIEGVRA